MAADARENACSGREPRLPPSCEDALNFVSSTDTQGRYHLGRKRGMRRDIYQSGFGAADPAQDGRAAIAARPEPHAAAMK
jgi:hypothetical protein